MITHSKSKELHQASIQEAELKSEASPTGLDLYNEFQVQKVDDITEGDVTLGSEFH